MSNFLKEYFDVLSMPEGRGDSFIGNIKEVSMALEYFYDKADGVVLRIDYDMKIYEGYNWKEKKWQNSKNAYAASVGFYDGFLDEITEQDAEKIISEN